MTAPARCVRLDGDRPDSGVSDAIATRRLNPSDVEPSDMLAELCEDNKMLAARLREAHGVCDESLDISTASLIENWLDETERRTWFLFEAGRRRDSGGR